MLPGNPVADGWAGAVMKNRSQFKNISDGRMDRRTDGSTRQGVESRFRDLKNMYTSKEPVMAAVAVRKKVGHFSPSFVFYHFKSLYLIDQIKSNYIY